MTELFEMDHTEVWEWAEAEAKGLWAATRMVNDLNYGRRMRDGALSDLMYAQNVSGGSRMDGEHVCRG